MERKGAVILKVNSHNFNSAWFICYSRLQPMHCLQVCTAVCRGVAGLEMHGMEQKIEWNSECMQL